MKQTLQLKLSQHLTLTPQLQQSIRLLQLSTLELNQEIEKFLQDNPLLERDDVREEPPAPPQSGSVETSPDSAPASTTDNAASTADAEGGTEAGEFEEDYSHGGT